MQIITRHCGVYLAALPVLGLAVRVALGSPVTVPGKLFEGRVGLSARLPFKAGGSG